MAPSRRRYGRALTAALALVLLPSLASAHTALKRSEPAKDAVLASPPARIWLSFTARPQLAFSKILLEGPGGEVALGAVRADTGHSLHAAIPVGLRPGAYRVSWQTASADGHPIRGEFSFTILPRVGESVPAAGTSQVGSTSSGGPARHDPVTHVRPAGSGAQTEYRSARWMEFVAVLTVLGALGFRHGVLPPLAARGVPTADAADRARRLGQSAVLLYLIAAVVRLYTTSVALHGAQNALDRGVLSTLLTATTWGMGWFTGVVGALLVFVGWVASRRSVAVGTPLALTGALGVVASPSLSGHAAASEPFVVSVTLDMLHLTAAGVWIGGLLMVFVAGIPAMRRLAEAGGSPDAAISALVSSFHPVALFCAPIVVLAGLGTSWIRLGGVSALWQTEYGRTLILKLLAFACVAGIGAYNALRARKRLGSADASRRFRFTAAGELLFAALVLAVTTFLVSAPVPSEMVSP